MVCKSQPADGLICESRAMKQMSLATTGFELVTKRTRKGEFLDEMDLVIPWTELLALIAPHAPAGKTGRSPFPTEVMLASTCWNSSLVIRPGHVRGPARYPAVSVVAHLDAGISRLPEESTILRFRYLLEEHGLGQQILPP